MASKPEKKKKSPRKTGNQPNNKMSFATDIPIPLFYLYFYFVFFFLKKKKKEALQAGLSDPQIEVVKRPTNKWEFTIGNLYLKLG